MRHSRFLFFSLTAGQIFWSHLGLACLEAPKDVSRRLWDSLAYEGSYDPKAAAICDGLKYTLSKQGCRESLRFTRFSSSALDWCEEQQTDNDKLACLREFSNAYFNATAFAMCAKMRYALNRSECFATARNKAFDSDSLARCAKESFDPGRNRCLEANSSCLRIDVDPAS